MDNNCFICLYLFISILCVSYVTSCNVSKYRTEPNYDFEEDAEVDERCSLPALKWLLELREENSLITEDIKKDEKVIIEEYTAGLINKDIFLNISQLVEKYSYMLKEYEVITEDGYILKLFRIPRFGGPVVFLMHGLTCSADDWVTAGPESGIAYLLFNAGYDVWLGNARGNKHSRRHQTLSPDADACLFWDFSWDEIGRYDLPAMIDFILDKTGQSTLKYVGHSQGTTSFFVMCSERPEYNDKISLMVALSAVAWMKHIRSPIVRRFLDLTPGIFFGAHEFLPNTEVLQIVLCGTKILAKVLCNNIAFLLGGFDYDQLNITNLPVIYSHLTSGAATKQITHYAQEVKSARFCKFDYGPVKNIKKYFSIHPPSYRVEKITAPVAIFYSEGDWLADVRDVKVLKRNLPNVVEFYKIPHRKFNHFDFLWAKDVKELVVKKLLRLLDIY